MADTERLTINKPRFLIRLRCETKLFKKSRSSRTIFEEGNEVQRIRIKIKTDDLNHKYFEFKNGSKFLVLKKNLVLVDF